MKTLVLFEKRIIREELQSQIDSNALKNSNELLSSEAFWMLMCVKNPALASRYTLDSEYDVRDYTLQIVISMISAEFLK